MSKEHISIYIYLRNRGQTRAEAQGFRYYIVRSLEDFQELIRELI